MKIGIKSHTCEELVPNPHTCEKLIPNYQRCEKLVPNYHRCEELVLVVTDVSDKTVKNWNRMQNAADLEGVFYQSDAYAYMLYRAYFSQSVRYWYEICDVLVPIFHML